MEYSLDKSGAFHKIIWVNAYSASRHYGGPEEGGWYYDWYDCIASCPVRPGDGLEEIGVKRIIKEALGWDPTRYEKNHGGARFTVNGGDDFVIYVEDRRAESQSTERPHYE